MIRRIVLAFGMVLLCGIAMSMPKIHDNTGRSVFYEQILLIIAGDLKLDTAEIDIIINNSEFNKNFVDAYATITKIDTATYSFNIQADMGRQNIIIAYIHELTHLSQITQSRMVIGRNYVWFEGKLYYKNTPVERLRYEREALQTSFQLWTKHRALFKAINLPKSN